MGRSPCTCGWRGQLAWGPPHPAPATDTRPCERLHGLLSVRNHWYREVEMATILCTLRKRPTAPLGQRGAPAGPLGVGGHVLPLSFRFGAVFCAIESQTQGDSAQPRQAANTTRCLVTALKPHAGARRPRAKFWSWGGSARGREAFPFWDTLLRPQRGAVKSLRWSPRDAWCPRVHRESGQRAQPRVTWSPGSDTGRAILGARGHVTETPRTPCPTLPRACARETGPRHRARTGGSRTSGPVLSESWDGAGKSLRESIKSGVRLILFWFREKKL